LAISSAGLDLSGVAYDTVFMNSTKMSGKPSSNAPRPPLQAKRLLDQVRERLRYLHYSLRTEQTYVYWVRWFVRFHGVRHPKGMGAAEVEAFLTPTSMTGISARECLNKCTNLAC
jgi:hypothetical protein